MRLTGLHTSNEPTVRVILADHPITGNAVEDRGSVDLVDLAGNSGNQNYLIRANVDLGAVKALALYCERCHLNFGPATLCT